MKQIIKNGRIKKGWSQAELGKKVGLSNGAIGMYETGERLPRHYVLKRLAEILEVPIQKFYDDL